MTTRVLLLITAVGMAVVGASGLFLPEEVLTWLGVPVQGLLPLLVQLFGAHYLALAAMNWMAKDTPFGGIYQRPAAMANVMHFVVGALVLLKAAMGGPASPALWIAAGIYAIFAVWFAYILFMASPTQSTL